MRAIWKALEFHRDGHRPAAIRRRTLTKKFIFRNCRRTNRRPPSSPKTRRRRRRRNSTPIRRNSTDLHGRNSPSSRKCTGNLPLLERKRSSAFRWKSRLDSVSDSSPWNRRPELSSYFRHSKSFRKLSDPRNSSGWNRFPSCRTHRNREKFTLQRRSAVPANSFRPEALEKVITKAITTGLNSGRGGRQPEATRNTSRPIVKSSRRPRPAVASGPAERGLPRHRPYSIIRPASRDHLAQSSARLTSLKSNRRWT